MLRAAFNPKFTIEHLVAEGDKVGVTVTGPRGAAGLRGVLRVRGRVPDVRSGPPTALPTRHLRVLPRDTPHTFKVVSAIPGKKLVLFSPAAMLAYF